MPNTAALSFTEFPPFDAHTETPREKHDSPFEFTFEDHFEEHYNNVKSEMAGAGSPFIKSEGSEFFNFNQFSPSQHQNTGFDINSNHFNVDPSQLAQNGNAQFGQSSFNMGNAGIADDELADLAGSLDNHQMRNGMNQPGFFNANGGSLPVTMAQPNMNNIYSSTPEGAPIQSPFVNHDGFNYGHFRTNQQQPQPQPQPQQQQQQQQQRNMSHSQSAGFANNVMRAQHMHNMERKISESRSPASPHTPGLSNLHIGEPEYPVNMRQQMISSSVPAQWDGSPATQSWNDNSPYPSPASVGHHMHHAQISEVLRSDDQQRPHIKNEPGVGGPGVTYTSVEAKRRRRRESHNLVERRRRDNINERIQDLANLVPQHRLEDEKVRKHLQTNSPLSPSIQATSMSPPSGSNVLSTSAGRRTGTITQGLPMDDKDKGPNKGDILNSSVSWTRDVVWYLQLKMEQERRLQELLKSNGIEWPFQKTDDETRMRSEIEEVIDRNVRSNNITPYTRTQGTGLRVPGFTNIAGDILPSEGSESMPSSHHPGPSHWQSQPVFKEEDEFDEDML